MLFNISKRLEMVPMKNHLALHVNNAEAEKPWSRGCAVKHYLPPVFSVFLLILSSQLASL